MAEFEPGIIDAYEGEDKLWSLLAYMDKQPFWMNALDIKGVERIGKDICAERLRRIIKSKRDFLPEQVSTSPCWGEVSYFNTFNNDEMLLDKRDYLLGWVFAIIEYQLGFSLELALKGSQLFGDAVFEELADYSIKMISRKHSLLPIRVRKLWYKIQNIFA